jgi:DNA-binding LacI/PurR family transcriptional regulator/DNA-binding transcriptional regulator YhcF (GntR family)
MTTYQFLRDLIDAGRAEGVLRLPPIRRIADTARVSTSAVWKAVRRLKDENRVVTRQGAWIGIAGTGAVDPLLAADETGAGLKWHGTAGSIRRDIANGRFLPGQRLPAVKELLVLYSVNYRTMRKALAALIGERSIAPVARGYRVAPLLGRQGRGLIALVAGGYPDGSLFPYTFRTQDYVRTLEEACSRAGLDLAIITFDTATDRIRVPARWQGIFSGKAGNRAVLGFLVIPTGLRPLGFDGLLSTVAQSGKPVAVLDENGDLGLSAFTALHGVRLFRISCSAGPGALVGRSLVQMGHRSIAYLSLFHQQPWSRGRLAGLRQSCEPAGASVHPFVSEDYNSSATITPVAGMPTLPKALDGALSRLIAMLNARMNTMEFARTSIALRRQVDAFIQLEINRSVLVPLMQAAYATPGITAWVGTSDATALICAEFLRSRGKRVPQDVSVMGFDDSYEAFTYKLTSCNFNGPAYIRAMVRHILDPGAYPASKVRGPIELDGYIAVRETTGPAARLRTLHDHR